MYDTKITWDGEQHVVWLSHPFDWWPISNPLEDWFKLTAVQFAVFQAFLLAVVGPPLHDHQPLPQGRLSAVTYSTDIFDAKYVIHRR